MSRKESRLGSRRLGTSSNIREQTKVCPRCQRAFTNRKKWQARGQWESIVYCSERCRRQTSS